MKKNLKQILKIMKKYVMMLITLLEKINETNDKLKKFNGSKIIINQMNKVIKIFINIIKKFKSKIKN